MFLSDCRCIDRPYHDLFFLKVIVVIPFSRILFSFTYLYVNHTHKIWVYFSIDAEVKQVNRRILLKVYKKMNVKLYFLSIDNWICWIYTTLTT